MYNSFTRVVKFAITVKQNTAVDPWPAATLLEAHTSVYVHGSWTDFAILIMTTQIINFLLQPRKIGQNVRRIRRLRQGYLLRC